jgi:hypothetical protein
MPFAVQAYEYLLHQIFSLMRTGAHPNQARRKRSTQGSRNFFEHALIYDGFAASLGAHGVCPALLSLFHGHLFRSRCPNLLQIKPRKRNSDHSLVSRLRKPNSSEERIGAHCDAFKERPAQ